MGIRKGVARSHGTPRHHLGTSGLKIGFVDQMKAEILRKLNSHTLVCQHVNIYSVYGTKCSLGMVLGADNLDVMSLQKLFCGRRISAGGLVGGRCLKMLSGLASNFMGYLCRIK